MDEGLSFPDNFMALFGFHRVKEKRMNIKLEAALYKKYPKIFRQRKLPMTETCMCWGISCGDGWYKIIDDLCADIQVFCDQNKCQIEATQVKEKFGTLRFYTGASCDSVED